MKKIFTTLVVLPAIIGLLSIFFTVNAKAQESLGNNFSTDTANKYPVTAFSITSSIWSNWNLFNVSAGHIYEWTYFKDYEGVLINQDIQLALLNHSTGENICFSNNICSSIDNAPHIRWTATYTGMVELLISPVDCEGSTGISGNNSDNDFVIYPNPASDNITIDVSQKATIEILNMQGKLMERIAVNADKTNIDVSTFPCGLYVMEMKSENGVTVNKFIKE